MTDSDVLGLFVSWAQEQGIQVKGVGPYRFPGRGVGIVANEDVKLEIYTGTEIINVSFNALLHPELSIPRQFRQRFNSLSRKHGAPKKATGALNAKRRRNGECPTTIHGLIAAFLTYDSASKSQYSAWRATWPTYEDFQTTMPFLWPEALTKLRCQTCHKTADKSCGHASDFVNILPPEISSNSLRDDKDDDRNKPNAPRGKFHTLRHKILSDWQAVLDAGIAKPYHHRHKDMNTPSPDSEPQLPLSTTPLSHIDPHFIHSWLIVNTRSFYFLPSPSHALLPPKPAPTNPDDSMVLCPLIDLFNHTSSNPNLKTHCTVSFSDAGFSVTANRVYSAGEELLVSYGAHSNGFLMGEYGFLLEGGSNRRDVVVLDSVVREGLNKGQRAVLEEKGYWGEYMLQYGQAEEHGEAAAPEVCWRTQVVAHLLVLTKDEWEAFVEGRFEDRVEAKDPMADGKRRKRDGTSASARRGKGKPHLIANANQKTTAQRTRPASDLANEKICAWLEAFCHKADGSLAMLKSMDEEEITDAFGGDGVVDDGGGRRREGGWEEVDIARQRARVRYDMVATRWTQIGGMCLAGREGLRV
ncbi:MAG: hypothetical protein Q9160_001455 [Pyrenula sp. 1 TL-2023]